jgi:hypothetical protein
MFLKGNLDWLDGAPVAQSPGQVEWQTRPRVGSPAQTIVVDRERLRQTQASLTTLANKFPYAMPRLVGDVDAWRQNVTLLLSSLKGAVHAGDNRIESAAAPHHTLSRPEARLVSELQRRSAELNELVRRVVWSGWYHPESRSFLLKWIVTNVDWIESHLRHSESPQPADTMLLIGDLVAQDGPDCLEFLRPGLGNPHQVRYPTAGLRQEISRFVAALRDWRNPRSIPPSLRPPSAIPYDVRIECFLHWLAKQDRPVRQRATRLASLVLGLPLLRHWQEAWERFQSEAHRAVRSLCEFARHTSDKQFHAEACRLSHELDEQLKEDPLPFPVGEILSKVERLSTRRSDAFVDTLQGLLGEIPLSHDEVCLHREHWALRLALLSEAVDSDSETQGRRYLELSRKFIQDNRAHAHRFQPWNKMAANWNETGDVSWSLHCTLQEQLPNPQKWPMFFQVLTRVAGESGYGFRRNDFIATLVLFSTNAEQAVERYLQAAPLGLLEDCTDRQVRTAVSLETEGFCFTELLELVGPSGQVEYSQLPSLRRLHLKFVEAGWAKLIPSLLRMKRGVEVCRLAALFQVASSRSESLAFLTRPAESTIPPWAQHLPDRLHPAIALHETLFPDARTRLGRILEKHFPDQERLQTEIATLERLSAKSQWPPDSSLPCRLNNLRQRLSQPRAVSRVALDRLQQKLDEALLTDLFRDAVGRVESILENTLGSGKHFGDMSVAHLALVCGILDLNEPYKSFGLRLLKKCWGDVPWDLPGEPANRRFLESLRARGIRTEPWLHRRHRHIVDEQSRHWDLAFESNEVETLLMGYHFDTCLSPNGCNFFSAVVNAIDINKRVLYLRSGQGDVAGRCLFAIGEAGTILAYRPYCHDSTINFDQMVAQFASDLAAEMGTVVSHTDRVASLVAPEWYDDGAYDLGNSIAGDQSPLRGMLKVVAAEDLMTSLETVLRPAVLTDSMLELIVEFPELQARPELIRPLLPLFEARESRLGGSALMAAARLADRAGAADVARRWLRRYGPDWIRRRIANHGMIYGDVEAALRLLIQYHPSIALRLLRETRPSSVRRDQDESDSRRHLIADCFSELGRGRLAIAVRPKTTN